jgi:hypothetical protein
MINVLVDAVTWFLKMATWLMWGTVATIFIPTLIVIVLIRIFSR